MRPVRPTAVHKTDRLAELVCSNSFRGDKLDNAVGLLKEEMRRLGSLVMRAAEASRVPAGAALAVDRERFAERVTERDRVASAHHASCARRSRAIPASSATRPVIVATGPLTSDALSAEIAALVGAEHSYFYDAISPIVLAETIDRSKVFRASRWDGAAAAPRADARSHRADGAACGVDDGEGDYLNCPFTSDEYERFYDALIAAENRRPSTTSTRTKFFEGCLPIEVMAHRGVDTLRFGPMKPVGLDRSAHRPRAVRGRAAAAGQPRRRPLQPRRVPDADQMGRAGARAAADSRASSRPSSSASGWSTATPTSTGRRCCAETWQMRTRPTLFFAGQMSGVEGYVESAASGLIAGLNAAALAAGEPLSVAAADDGDRRAGVLRVARGSRALRAVEHHVRHHRAARGSAARQDGAQDGDVRTRARRSGGVEPRSRADVGAPHARVSRCSSI